MSTDVYLPGFNKDDHLYNINFKHQRLWSKVVSFKKSRFTLQEKTPCLYIVGRENQNSAIYYNFKMQYLNTS